MIGIRSYASPLVVMFLVLPYGISSGFASVTIPFLLTQNGFSVAAAAGITALGLSANIWRFLWAPFTDLTLSLHKWYLIGLSLCSLSLLVFCFIPLQKESAILLTIIVLFSQVAATLVVSPVGGFMAKTIREDQKGRAAGCYQAGNLGGMGIGGGAGIWLSTHFSYQVAIVVIAITMLVCATALYWIPSVKSDKTIKLAQGFTVMIQDIKGMFRNPISVYTTFLIVTPIGAGAAAYIWSSVATDWKVLPDTVALVTGVLSGLMSAVGCVAGGWAADKSGRWNSFFGSGILLALVTLYMAIAPLEPVHYITGVLLYAFSLGTCYAAFSAVVLFAIGKGVAATKYALLSSISNLAPVYMTAFDGWLHDEYSIVFMLLGETVLALLFAGIFLFILYRIQVAEKLLKPVVVVQAV